jgi:hypothetical protein
MGMSIDVQALRARWQAEHTSHPMIAATEARRIMKPADVGQLRRAFVASSFAEDDPTEEETMKLKTLGWIFDGEYVTLYCPNIYEVPTMEELKKAKNEVQSKV